MVCEAVLSFKNLIYVCCYFSIFNVGIQSEVVNTNDYSENA